MTRFFFNMKVTTLKVLILISFFILSAVSSVLLILNKNLILAYEEICSLVHERIYLENTKDWYKSCLVRAEKISLLTSKKSFVEIVNDNLSELDVSHLYVYSPVDTQMLWLGSAKTTGLIVIRLNDSYYITSILNSSVNPEPKFGDKIISVNGKKNLIEVDFYRESGVYEVIRKGINLKYFVNSSKMKIDDYPNLKKITNDIGLLSVSSFRIEYFDKKKWKQMVSEMNKYSKIIIDLRGNGGGSFISMLRALSPLICETKTVGHLSRRTINSKVLEFSDEDDVQEHLKTFYYSSQINLKLFSNYNCFRGDLVVIVDSYTTSVSEMFSQIIKQSKRGKIVGNVSRGQVLLGVWYDLIKLGKDYSISIPEANFYDLNNQSIEKTGVLPDHFVFYEEKDLINGEDSFILKAIE
jgi:C-terminal processing protease CtpA/Prc